MKEPELDGHTRSMLLRFFDDPIELDDPPESIAVGVADRIDPPRNQWHRRGWNP